MGGLGEWAIDVVRGTKQDARESVEARASRIAGEVSLNGGDKAAL